MAKTPAPNNPESAAPARSRADQMAQDALAAVQSAVDQINSGVNTPPQAQALDLPALDPAPAAHPAASGIELLGDVELHVAVELGRTQMLVEDVLQLAEGSIVELDKLAGDPVDVYVNQHLIARGEVLVLNDNFCIRISEIVTDLEEQAAAAASQQQGAQAVQAA